MAALPARAQVDLGSASLRLNAGIPENGVPGAVRRLEEILAEAQSGAPPGVVSKDLSVAVYDESAVVGTRSTQTLLLNVYENRACLADAIVVGQPQRWIYHLSDSGTSVYGDYDFQLTRALKGNPRSSIAAVKDIIVTRPGGTYAFDEGNVEFDAEFFPRLSKEGVYFMFLRHIPGSNSYAAVDNLSTLVLSGDTWQIDRKVYSGLNASMFGRAEFEGLVAGWISGCLETR